MIDKELQELIKDYIIPCIGDYNSGVFECPNCGKNILNNFYAHVIGFSNAYIGFVKVTECPKCFEKYYSHCSDMDAELFIDCVKSGRNIHHKPKN